MDGYAERKDTLFSTHGLPNPRFQLLTQDFARRVEVDGQFSVEDEQCLHIDLTWTVRLELNPCRSMLDTLFLPALLRQGLEVQSVCPMTHREIRLMVTLHAVVGCYPPEVVISLVTTECHVPGPRGDFCGHIFFFASRAEATRWTNTQSGFEILPVDEAFMLAQAVYR